MLRPGCLFLIPLARLSGKREQEKENKLENKQEILKNFQAVDVILVTVSLQFFYHPRPSSMDPQMQLNPSSSP